jgi:hypothetical protein
MKARNQIPAVSVARELYRRNGLNFEKDLEEHLHDGYVIALPDCFAMARAMELSDGRKAWWVQCAVGRLRNLARFMPFYLPFIAFRRGKNGRKRVYSTARLLHPSLPAPDHDPTPDHGFADGGSGARSGSGAGILEEMFA